MTAFDGPSSTSLGHTLTRRRLLAATAAVAGGALLPAAACARTEPNPERPPVIVIGAGIAGLTAANLLRTAGVDVFVLEARDRVGGRIQTTEIAGSPVDLGASWIHTPRGNPLTALMDELGVATVPLSPDSPVRAFDESAGDVLTPDVKRGLYRAYEGFDDASTRLIRRLGPDASLQEGIERFAPGPGNRLVRTYLALSVATLDYALSAPDLALASQGLYHESLSGPDLIPVGGYGQLIEALAEPLDIRTGHVVEAISVESDGVEVQASGENFQARSVVVTLPLGVLKAGTVDFSPPLPESKQSAIDRLRMGNLEKVVLAYADGWWRDGPDRLNLLEISSAEAYPSFVDLGPPGATLMCLYGGRFAEQHSRDSQEEKVRMITEVLGRITGMQPPPPLDVRATDWTNDPFSLGSYSNLTPGAGESDLRTLAEPIWDRLVFAGEATVPSIYQTVHGAYASGVRAAAQILGAPAEQLSFGPAPTLPE